MIFLSVLFGYIIPFLITWYFINQEIREGLLLTNSDVLCGRFLIICPIINVFAAFMGICIVIKQSDIFTRINDWLNEPHKSARL